MYEVTGNYYERYMYMMSTDNYNNMCEKFKLGFKKIIFCMHINKEKYTKKLENKYKNYSTHRKTNASVKTFSQMKTSC